MNIYIGRFNGGIGFLQRIMEDPRFDYDNWDTLWPLVAEFKDDLLTCDARHPGWHNEFKLALQFVLNQPDYDIEAHLDRIMDFSLPEPVYEFLVHLWTLLYPGEAWQAAFDERVVKVHWK